MQEIDLRQASVELKIQAKSGNVPLFLGPPGVGKSAITHQFAKNNNLKLIDLRLSSMLPEDFNGFPRFTEKGKAEFCPFDFFPLEGESLPINPDTDKPYNGWLLFLDEMTSADKAVQAPVYKVVLDRMINQALLHKNVVIAGAGNRIQDRAVAHNLSTALKSRLITYTVSVSVKGWMTWAIENNIDSRIRAWINFKPNALHDFDANRDDHTFPCPRTWEFLSNILTKADSEISPEVAPRIAGTIGSAAAAEFITFAAEFHNLPKVKDVLNDPDGTIVPDKASTRYCIATVLADHLADNGIDDPKIIPPLLKYITRYEPEFQVVFCKAALTRQPKLRTHQNLVNYAMNFVKEF